MEKEALKALKASIKKWERNAKAQKPGDVKLGTSECPLCQLYFSFLGNHCIGCPVEEKTGQPLCLNTPYSEADIAQYRWEHGLMTREGFLAAAQAEVDFLRSLLPEGEVA